MTKLKDLADVLRSKNAGTFQITIDIIFENPEIYKRVKNSNAITKKLISKIYAVPEEQVLLIEYDVAYAIKITIPRKVSAGGIDDTDVYGAQQHAPLLDLEIPV